MVGDPDARHDPGGDEQADHEQAGHEQAVRELATAYDVAVDYWDWQGRHVVVSTATLVSVLGALGVDAGSAASARAGLAAKADAAWRRLLPPVLVAREGLPA